MPTAKHTNSDKSSVKAKCKANQIKNLRSVFNYIRSMRPASESVAQLDDQGAFGVDKSVEEKLNKVFALVFTTEDTGEFTMLDKSLDHNEVTRGSFITEC